ncbi:MAG: matrixin [Rhizobium sp.]|nr:matrixin [Rhizobium sp.]
MSTISFSEWQPGTKDPFIVYKGNTVRFHGETYLDQGANPAIAPNAQNFKGTVSWTFENPSSKVEFDAGYLDAPGTITVKFFDSAGHVLSTMTNSQPSQHFSFSSQKGIAKVVVNSTTDDYALDNVSFTTTFPQVGLSHDRDIDGLLWGWKWGHKDLTYSFPNNSNEYSLGGYQNVTGFQALSGQQKAAYEKIIDNFDGVCGLSFHRTTKPLADIRFGEANSIDYGDAQGPHKPGNGTAEGNPPDPTRAQSSWGDVWLGHGAYDQPKYGSFAYAAGLMHELGHALGLKHGHVSQQGHGVTFPALPKAHNSYEYSIMTYTQYPGDPTPNDSAVDHPTTLMQDDIAALQYLYGADFKYRSTDTTYRFDRDGQMLVNGQGQGVPLHHRALLTIWDGGGHDTYDFSNRKNDLSIDLAPGNATTFGPRANLGEGHLAHANVYSALLYKGNEASLIERAIGGTGDDRIYGNGANNALLGGGGRDRLNGRDGNDRLTGGGSADHFIFNTRLKQNVDEITDFKHGQDRIDIDNAIFKGLRNGQLDTSDFKNHFDYNQSNGALFFDADGRGGHGGIKFAELNPHQHLTASDFLVI